MTTTKPYIITIGTYTVAPEKEYKTVMRVYADNDEQLLDLLKKQYDGDIMPGVGEDGKKIVVKFPDAIYSARSMDQELICAQTPDGRFITDKVKPLYN